MIYPRIIGTGSCLPERILTNEELARDLDTSDDWIRERTGIRQRHLVADDQTTVDLAAGAARNALAAASIEADTLDLIVVGTATPDRIYPSTACRLQARIGAGNCTAFDVQAVCTGFVYALGIAEKFVRAGSAKRVLVVGADTHSRLLDWSDRSTCVLFGDGAGAVVLESSATPGVLSTHLHADGRCESLLYVEGGTVHGQVDALEGVADAKAPAGKARTIMKGKEVFRFAVRALGGIVEETLNANGIDKSAVDWLVPHQANIRIIEATVRQLGMSMERVIVTLGKHGNTSAASVPLALDTAVRDGRIKPGQMLLLEAFGGGFTWGSALVRY